MSTHGAISDAMLEQVYAAVPCCGDGMGLTPAEVHARVGTGAPGTVRHALRGLVACGRVTFDGPDTKRRYRRPVEIDPC